MWTILKEWFDEFVLLKYKADKHVLPPRKRPPKTQTKTEPLNLAGHSVVRGQLWAPDNGDDVLQTTAAWKQDDVRNGFGQRQAELTDMDMQELSERGLSSLKAAQVKPYFAQGFTIAETSAALSRVGSKKLRGYSVRTIAEYYSAFSAATGGGEDPQ